MISERTIDCSSSLPKRVLFALVLLGTFFILCSGSHAGETELSFDIPSQEIAPALKQFADQTGLSLVYKLDDAGSMQSPGVSGTHSPDQALGILLAGTGLSFQKTGERSLAIVDAGEGALVAEQAQPAEAQRPAEGDHVIAQATEPRQAAAQADAGDTKEPEEAEAAEEEKQPAKKEMETFRLDEIMVTAEKREESIFEVPITMTAFSSRLIDELGITNDADLEQLVPGLQMLDDDHIGIRGLWTKNVKAESGDPAVAVYVDGVYTVDPYGVAPNMFDVERVEVARGPQGTLHGRNSIGGAVFFHSKRPTAEWDAAVQAEFTDQFTQRFNVAFGGPLSDLFSFRVTGGYFQGDGAQENVGPADDYGAPDRADINTQLRFKMDRWDLNLSYKHVRDRGSPTAKIYLMDMPRDNNTWPGQFRPWYLWEGAMPSIKNCPGSVLSRVDNVSPSGRTNDRDEVNICDDPENIISANREGIHDSQSDRVAFTADFDISSALLLRYTFGTGATDTYQSRDADGTGRVGDSVQPWKAADPADVPVSQRPVVSDQHTISDYESEEYSHELVFTSDFDGPLNFVAGFYHYNNETDFSGANRDEAPQILYSMEAPYGLLDGDAVAAALDGGPNDYDYLLSDDGENLPGTWMPHSWYGITSEVGGEIYRTWPNNRTEYDGDLFVINSCEDFADALTHIYYGWEDSEKYGAYVNYEPANGLTLDRWLDTGNMFVSCNPADFPYTSTYRGNSESKTVAGFAHADYRFSDQWAVTAGLRYTKDEKSVDYGNYSVMRVFGVPMMTERMGTQIRPDENEDWIWSASLEYTPAGTNTLIYGRVSNGQRLGGSRAVGKDAFGEEETVGGKLDAEELINYELGLKGMFLDDRLMLTSAVFYNDYKTMHFMSDQFVPEEELTPFTSFPYRMHMGNVDDNEIYGAEVEVSYYLGERWRLSGYYNWLDSKIGSHEAFIYGAPVPAGNTFVWRWLDEESMEPREREVARLVDVTGNQLPQQPEHKYALTVAYETDVLLRGVSAPLGTVQFLSTYSHTGARWANIGNVPGQQLPAYGRWDLRANWQSPGGQWAISLFAQNVWDTIGIRELNLRPVVTYGLNAQVTGTLTEPRRIGMLIRYTL